jgi:GNAT superfamily N-acetyltransferase
MKKIQISDINFAYCDEEMKENVRKNMGEVNLHLSDGFSVVALYNEKPVGIISVYKKLLPPPLPETYEGYIDIIEVVEEYRMNGIAREILRMSIDRARKEGYYQLRAWSTDDKIEAIPVWKALGFCLCPTTHSMWGEKITGYFVTYLL